MTSAGVSVRLGVRLALGAHPGQRLRLALLGGVAVVVGALSLLTVGVVDMLDGERQRLEARSIVAAEPGERAVVTVERRHDTWGREQFPVVQLDPMNDADPAGLPPGMSAWPRPGGWYISPGLAAEARRHPELAARFPDARVLDDSGVLNPGELLAYRRLPADGTFGWYVVQAVGFGMREGEQIGDSTELDVPAMALAMAGFAGVPLILLAATGVSVSSPQRARRLALLRSIGVPARRLRLLLVAETVTICGPGLALGGLLWCVAANGLTSVPFVDRPAAEGALVPAWPLVAGTLVALLAAFALLAPATERLQRRRGAAGLPRPQAGRPALAMVRIAPALAGLALLLLAATREERAAAVTALAGVVVLSLGIPLVLPLIARAAGARLASSATRPDQVLSGRRLQYDPRSAVRPLYGLAALLVIFPVVASWVSSARELDPPRPVDSAVETVRLRGALESLDLDRLLREVPGAVPVSVHETGGGVRLGVSCGELETLLREPACDPAGSLRPEAARRLQALTFGPPVSGLAARDLTGLSTESTLLVFAPRDPAFEPTIRTAALAQPAVLFVISEADFEQQESALVAWIFGGFTLLCALLFLILAVGVTDRTASGRRGTRLLTALGLTSRQVRGVNNHEFLFAYAVVVGTGLAAGVAASLSWSSLDSSAPYPLNTVLLLTVSALALGGVGLLTLRITDRAPHPGE
jgi:hypothetical protein